MLLSIASLIFLTPIQDRVEEMLLDSAFIFIGTQTGTSGGQAQVKVEKVLDANKFGQRLVGKTVATTKPGEQGSFVFFTNGLSYGKQVLLKEVGRDKIEAFQQNILESDADPRLAIRSIRVSSQVRKADLVVSGTVKDIKKADSQERKGISEHDPEWMVATISPDKVHKGREQETIQVVFPSTTDPMWSQIPRLERGDRGLFALHKKETWPRPKLTYTFTSALDFVQSEEVKVIELALARGIR